MKALSPFRRVKASRAQWKALFALTRAATDDALLSALFRAPQARGAKRSLVDEARAELAPILAPAAEKAAYLIAHMEETLGRPLNVRAKSFAAVVRALERELGQEPVRAGVRALLAKLTQAQGGRDLPP